MTDDDIDRLFPHQVVLPAECYAGALYRSIHAFCIGLSLAERGHVVLTGGAYRFVFCFAEAEDADKLRRRYGGQWFKDGECEPIPQSESNELQSFESKQSKSSKVP